MVAHEVQRVEGDTADGQGDESEDPHFCVEVDRGQDNQLAQRLKKLKTALKITFLQSLSKQKNFKKVKKFKIQKMKITEKS